MRAPQGDYLEFFNQENVSLKCMDYNNVMNSVEHNKTGEADLGLSPN